MYSAYCTKSPLTRQFGTVLDGGGPRDVSNSTPLDANLVKFHAFLLCMPSSADSVTQHFRVGRPVGPLLKAWSGGTTLTLAPREAESAVGA